ncbi:PhzF family phenazine biosynthesis protein [Rhodoferax lacus]|uniref:PhzF family phenazine biosynthesis protein n=1 Tax=Rhodoferax lacus TaxID=2184758 RepID=A0A3E1RC10_9BURK|nr:PhzF family phenazine biosynthesis protein [Rhodoferax lacus]RFO96793.1 PhzF family phenazine biosynthesis protein [Rhodoferax lacus]
MNVLRIAAFSDDEVGGNPAGVVIADELPSSAEMMRIASEVGYSETVFATRQGAGWRVRYFSPTTEVAFCGHATIALGAALTLGFGSGVFPLVLNQGDISVEGRRQGNVMAVALQSPPTRSRTVAPILVSKALALFGFRPEDIHPDIPPAVIHAGADHLVLMLNSREALSSMNYDFETGRALMLREGWVTVLLGYAETPQLFHTRNAFAYGGVYEDPATGAATAALAGYLRDIQWPHKDSIEVVQGHDMGVRCLLRAEFGSEIGSSIRVCGTARMM